MCNACQARLSHRRANSANSPTILWVPTSNGRRCEWPHQIWYHKRYDTLWRSLTVLAVLRPERRIRAVRSHLSVVSVFRRVTDYLFRLKSLRWRFTRRGERTLNVYLAAAGMKTNVCISNKFSRIRCDTKVLWCERRLVICVRVCCRCMGWLLRHIYIHSLLHAEHRR